MSKVFGYSSVQTFLKIYLPLSKKLIVDGVRTATGFGWRAIIIGEVLAQPLHGIGSGMKLAQVYLNVSELFAWTLVAVLVSYLFDLIILSISRFRFSSFRYTRQHSVRKSIKSIKSVELKQLSKAFDSNPIITNFSVELVSGKVYLLKSASGKGKTSLLKLLANILQPDTGKLVYNGVESLAFSFQDIRLCPWLTVKQNILFADSSKTNMGLINQLITELELAEIQDKWPSQLSGGQQQRVALARALAAKADLLLLDEPLNGLDAALKKRVMTYLNSYILGYKPIVVWATHEDVDLKHVSVEVLMT
jgi:ABC-type nitrate/sulfonate/bicarbonate transport system ATPase subunit